MLLNDSPESDASKKIAMRKGYFKLVTYRLCKNNVLAIAFIIPVAIFAHALSAKHTAAVSYSLPVAALSRDKRATWSPQPGEAT